MALDPSNSSNLEQLAVKGLTGRPASTAAVTVVLSDARSSISELRVLNCYYCQVWLPLSSIM